jgi:hypothetical protein
MSIRLPTKWAFNHPYPKTLEDIRHFMFSSWSNTTWVQATEYRKLHYKVMDFTEEYRAQAGAV